MFRRRRSGEPDQAAEVDQAEGPDYPDLGLEPDGGESAQPADYRGDAGPWDVEELDRPRAGRIDLGSLLVPAADGTELQVEVVDQRIVSATTLFGQSQLKLQAFAAPRHEGIWDEIRGEIKGNISKQGGTVDEVDGPFGPELRARVPVRTSDGKSAVQVVRFFGVDGPRWFLHATLTGPAATEPGSAGPVEALLRDVVVVRGGDPMPPRELIPMRFPDDAEVEDAPDEEAEHGGRGPLDPFRRGPEITEVR
ncbi:MAG: DUF3710 domain-containing protein [Sporichthyaceae bacterium]|nr:DUF3710 domain-containing protein [Sporichthyaceae bacterium]